MYGIDFLGAACDNGIMEKQHGNIIVIGIAAVAIVSLLALAVLLYQNFQLASSNSSAKVLTPKLLPATETPPPAPVSPSPTTAAASPTAGHPQAVVVFEAEGSISQTDKDQLKARVVEPNLDYFLNLESGDYVVSMTVSPNTQASKTTYPYAARVIFKNGAYNSFSISKTKGAIDWWLPECMGPCPFSASFKAKYPEIVKLAQ